MSLAAKIRQDQLFACLYQENYSWLYAWLFKKLKQKQQAEDVLQDTFVKILNKADIDQITYAKSYLAQTATRIIIDQARRKYIEQAYLDYLTVQEGATDLNTPENILLALELLERIAVMLNGLEQQARQIFLLRYLEGLTQIEIAQQLDLSRRMVQLALIKALQHCDQILQD